MTAIALLAAGCGGSATTTRGNSAGTHTPLQPPAARFTATLHAPTHSPVVNAAWVYSIDVRDANGRPLRAIAETQFLFAGQVVGRESPPTHRFAGHLRDLIRWPRRSAGFPLTFRAVVHTSLGAQNLDYQVQVRR
jgi:hypothetical protein